MSKAVIAIIVAGGSGARLNLGFNKAFAEVDGEALISWAVQAFENHAEVSRVVIVAGNPKDEESLAQAKSLVNKKAWKKVSAIVLGGMTRMQSVTAGLNAAGSDQEALILVHDAARPFVQAETISAVIDGASEYGAAVCGVSLKDSVFTTKGGMLGEILERDTLVSIQTPVAARYDLIRESRAKAEREGYLEAPGIEDSAVIRRAGFPVQLVEGSYENFKVTTREDLVLAEYLAKDKRGGN